jgi:type IV secretory pathway VirB4 component
VIVVNKKHPETSVLNELRAKRKNVLQGLVRQIKSQAKPKLASHIPYFELVTLFENTFWIRLLSYNDKSISERMKQMFSNLQTEAALSAAFTALGLDVLVEELKTLQADIAASLNKRRKFASELPKMRTREVKSEVGEALTDLLKAIELAGKAHPELD